MSQALQIIARGPRAQAEAAAAAVDADSLLEGSTYSILEEDEDRGLWRIDAYPTGDAEAERFEQVLKESGGLKVTVEALADADWLATACSILPITEAKQIARQAGAELLITELKDGKVVYHSTEGFGRYWGK